MRKAIQDMIDKIDSGGPISYKVIKGRVPIVDGEEDWDQMETVSIEERVICPRNAKSL